MKSNLEQQCINVSNLIEKKIKANVYYRIVMELNEVIFEIRLTNINFNTRCLADIDKLLISDNIELSNFIIDLLMKQLSIEVYRMS
jgi:hypothetical protein